MAELTFNQAGNAYVAEFQAAEDFALHIERQGAGDFKVYQKTVAGEYAPISDIPIDIRYREVVDFDFTALVYPKFIKVVSENEPTYAEVVSNGEITELKYQEKSVEVTANGNTEVIPDAGFAGLTKVNVSVNVPQSGGGESGGEGVDVQFFPYPPTDETLEGGVLVALSQASTLVKVRMDFGDGNALYVLPSALLLLLGGQGVELKTVAFAVVMNGPKFQYLSSDGWKFFDNAHEYIIDQIRQMNSAYDGEEYLASLPRITKEEFYNLNA